MTTPDARPDICRGTDTMMASMATAFQAPMPTEYNTVPGHRIHDPTEVVTSRTTA